MVNILLPAYSRSYSTLQQAGLSTGADELERHELENLVLRERAVVWADQEALGDAAAAAQAQPRNALLGGAELVPVLSFSALSYHQSSPCSKSPRPFILLVRRSPEARQTFKITFTTPPAVVYLLSYITTG